MSNTRSLCTQAYLTVSCEQHLGRLVVIDTDEPSGFAVIGDYKDAEIQRAQKAAFDQMLAWLKAH